MRGLLDARDVPKDATHSIEHLLKLILPLGLATRSPEAAKLLADALAAMECSNFQLSIAISEYTIRKFPSDLGILFALAVTRLAVGEPRACEPLELLAARLDWRDIWLLLARVRLRFGDTQQAAVELQTTLSRHAVPDDAASQRFSDRVAREAGAAGWCGVDGSGLLIVSGTTALPQVCMDDVAVPIRRANRPRGMPRLYRLPESWPFGLQLSVDVESGRLIGSPISIRRITAVEGFVEAVDGGLRGWCSMPGDNDRVPEISILRKADAMRAKSHAVQIVVMRADPLPHVAGNFPDFLIQRPFFVPSDKLPDGPLVILGPHGRSLYGSPLDPGHEAQSAKAAALVATHSWPAGAASPKCPDTLVLIPVYRGLATTIACIESVLKARSPHDEILVIADGSPDQELLARLDEMAAQGLILMDRQKVNRGFPATANIGLRCARGRDVALLNSDTLVGADWTARLRAIAHSAHDIGSVTPLSNDATIFSYPARDSPNAVLDAAATQHLNDLAYRANGSVAIEVPTGHGFCLYIRADCLVETGVFREDVFAQGYGEENDFCRRAVALGWRHVAAPGVYVGHVGSQSFGRARLHLQQRNPETLNRLHPRYERIIAEWIGQDPLAPARRQLDHARSRAAQGHRTAVMLVTHDRSGGVQRHVTEKASRLEQEGKLAIIVRPGPGRACRITTAAGDAFPNLIFMIPQELDQFADFVAECRIEQIEVHHFIGHDPALLDRLCTLGTPYDVVIHDYSWFCARSTLTAAQHRYCGEPDINECGDCLATFGQTIGEQITPKRLLERSMKWLSNAAAIVAPSADTAARISQRFGRPVAIRAWEDESAPLALTRHRRPADHRRRICLAGAIGPEKGYGIILRCARLAMEQELPLEFVIVGYTSDDQRLREAGVRITGPYQESEAVNMIRAQDADIAFMPGQLPETWSYVLSQFWAAGLSVVAFDIGAPAERIRKRKGGIVLPLHTPASRLVQILAGTQVSSLQAIAS